MKISAKAYLEGIRIIDRNTSFDANTDTSDVSLFLLSRELTEYYTYVLNRANYQIDMRSPLPSLQKTAFFCAAHFFMLQAQPDSGNWVVAAGGDELLEILLIDKPSTRRVLYITNNASHATSNKYDNKIVFFCSLDSASILTAASNILTKVEVLIISEEIDSLNRRKLMECFAPLLPDPSPATSAGKALVSTRSLPDVLLIEDIYNDNRDNWKLYHKALYDDWALQCLPDIRFLSGNIFLLERAGDIDARISSEQQLLPINELNIKYLCNFQPPELVSREVMTPDLRFKLSSGPLTFCYAYACIEAQSPETLRLLTRKHGVPAVYDQNSFVGMIIEFDQHVGSPQRTIIACCGIPVRPNTRFFHDGTPSRNGTEVIIENGEANEIIFRFASLAPHDWNGGVRVAFGIQNPGPLFTIQGGFEIW
ncbi:hypothetical protein [uncultured Rhodoblastus sp.]|uniref:hypothetical protein n=1 Tax=uncultured Rhodoblastus sp. TaxID=543037 RepID=UPI0025D82FD0|nr:hypothetical protein [uncultured Rhodoblastus sp.]